jgi:HEAT repeat protein
MGRSRDPVYLPTLRDCLETSWLSAGKQRKLFVAAVGSLTNHMNDEAAEILLDGAAAAPDAILRNACMEGVKALHEYPRARAEWEQRAGARATRDAAVAELVELLGDEDPAMRAESVRGLGLLGAVEQLPRVIRALQDGDAGVRVAAREALERLHAPLPAADRAADPAADPATDEDRVQDA